MWAVDLVQAQTSKGVNSIATEKSEQLLTAGKLAEALGVSQGKVKKLIEQHDIQPDEVKRGCKYYGSATLGKLEAALKSES